MRPEIRKYTLNMVDYVEEMCPEMMVIVDTYHPCYSNPPWDYHGMKHQREYGRVLQEAGIPFVPLVTRKTLRSPIGSGPGGRVRFGDNMTPGVYKIAVQKHDAPAAEAALAAHQQAINDWLYHHKPMPPACRG